MPRRSAPKSMRDVPRADRLRLARRFFFLSEDRRGCVPWEGHRDGKGYGQVRCGGRAAWAHRVYFALFVGPIPAGMTVHHECANPSCVNPRHLSLKTNSANAAEGNRRRRSAPPSPPREGPAPF